MKEPQPADREGTEGRWSQQVTASHSPWAPRRKASLAREPQEELLVPGSSLAQPQLLSPSRYKCRPCRPL